MSLYISQCALDDIIIPVQKSERTSWRLKASPEEHLSGTSPSELMWTQTKFLCIDVQLDPWMSQ